MVQSGVLGTVATCRKAVSRRNEIRERVLERPARHRPVIGCPHPTPFLALAESPGIGA